MRTNKKKITAIVFILLGFSPLLVALFISLKKEQIRHRMKAQFEIKGLQTVIQQESEVIWMDKHEIWVNNSMFDIKSKKLKNGIYIFTGLYDKDETNLKEIEKNTTGENKEQNNFLSQLFKNLPIFCNLSVEQYQIKKNYNLFNSFISKDIQKPYKRIVIPPPQVYC
ncbi:MAG: hypothetical protein ABIP79_07825 [Chitinophagaceae bacterium]